MLFSQIKNVYVNIVDGLDSSCVVHVQNRFSLTGRGRLVCCRDCLENWIGNRFQSVKERPYFSFQQRLQRTACLQYWTNTAN